MNTNFIFVVDKNRTPILPCHPAKARLIQSKGKAKMLRRYPGVLILDREVTEPPSPYLELRIDPGSKVTGFALINPISNTVIWGMELEHRGTQISEGLVKRAGFRRGRRSRRLRYRKKRFNRSKSEGWLAPSLVHRLETTLTWTKRICKYAPVASIAIEKVKFDLQKLENPDIEGVEYQQGTLAGYTIREALLEHWGRECAYCGASYVPLEIEHIHPKSRGGSNRFSNLTLSCHKCNEKKGNRSIEEFLQDSPEVLKRIKSHQKTSLRDASAVNSTRHAIFKMVSKMGLSVKAGDGASTKMMRMQAGFPKEHWLDAACVTAEKIVQLQVVQPLRVKASGHGSRQSRRANASGFPAITVKVDKLTGKKFVKVIEPKKTYKHACAGDVVKVTIEDRKQVKGGSYVARVKTPTEKGVEVVINGHRISVAMKAVKPIHRSDGYSYGFTPINADLLQFIAI